MDDEKATNGNGQQKQKKKNRSSDSEDHRESQQQIVVKSHSSPVLESEDEDGFPVSTEHKSNSSIQKPEAEAEQIEKKASEKTKKKKKINDGDQATGLKRKVESVDQDDHPERCDKFIYFLLPLILASNCFFFFSVFSYFGHNLCYFFCT